MTEATELVEVPGASGARAVRDAARGVLTGRVAGRGALVLRLSLWAAAYGAAVWLGRLVRVEGDQLALVWPAAAVSFLWLAGSWGRPRRALADVAVLSVLTVLGNLLTTAGWGLSLAMAPANVVHAVVAVAVVRRLRPDPGWVPRTVRHVLVLLAGAVTGALLSATLGAGALAVTAGAPWVEVAPAWVLRNASSTFVLATVLLVVWGASWRRPTFSWVRAAEVAVLVAAAATAYWLVVAVGGAGALALATLPLCAWTGTRFPTVVAAVLTALGGGVVIALTLMGHGPFAQDSPTLQVALAQALAAVTVLVTVLLAVHRDERHLLIAALRGALAQVQDRDERFRLAFDTAPVGMLMVAGSEPGLGRVLQVNEALTGMTGWSAGELVGRDVRGLLDGGEGGRRLADLLAGRVERVSAQERYLRADGGHAWGAWSASLVRPRSAEPYVMVLVEDVTARRAAEEVLTHRALHDALTGVANRTLLQDRLEQALAAAGRSGDRVGVLFLDLDGFKEVNDTAGHAAGDELLRQVASRLSDAVRPGDTVARLGGDEFVVLYPVVAADELAAIAERVRAVVREPYVLPDGAHVVSASVGAASAPGTATPGDVLRAADAAMYEAKRSGRDRVAWAAERPAAPGVPGARDATS
ncbi:hypothetical protein GCM10027194_29760 [Thalassiella azotivora]